jgi:hypothetical protein
MTSNYINSFKYDLNDDLIIYIDKYNATTDVRVWNWRDDIDVYRSKFVLYSVEEILDLIHYRLDNNLLNKEEIIY